MSLKHSYTLLAPIYDAIVARATLPMRKTSLARLGNVSGKNSLLAGVGTGLDLALLPAEANYTGIDITPAMLRRAQHRLPATHRIDLQVADVTRTAFADNSFDIVIMHLILAVVPQPELALQEAQRVLKPGGRILILDKFLRPGQVAPLRRLLNFFIRHIATRTDVVFEAVLDTCPSLTIIDDQPLIPGGWFRNIEVLKNI